MKTIVLQGTEEQISKVQLNSYAFPTEELPKLVEIRVYVIRGTDTALKLNDEDFITLAEKYGTVYTLSTFQEAFNLEEINTSIDVVRFISVPLFGEKMDTKTTMLKAIMERYGGLCTLKQALYEDTDTVLVNLCDDVNDEITEDEFLTYFIEIL